MSSFYYYIKLSLEVSDFCRLWSIYLYSMKIKEQTRKLAAGCSKHGFEVVDKTDEVSSKHCFEVVDGTDVVSILHIRQGDVDVV